MQLLWRRLKSLKATFPEVIEAVSSSDKQRFGLLYIPPGSSGGGQDVRVRPAETDEEATSTNPNTTNGDDSAAALATATAQALEANDPDPHNYLIRARQGHSMKTIDAASLLQQLSLDGGGLSSAPLPDTVVHGTFHATWPKILASGGLKCMGRNHIHFASGPPLSSILPDGIHGQVVTPKSGGGAEKKEGVISGMRADAQILIYINLKRALEAGCPFWVSENGVILSEGVAGKDDGKKVLGTEFFDVVVERKNGLGVVWEGGELLKETPPWMLNSKLPSGKGERAGGKAGKNAAPRVKVEKETEYVDYS